MSFFFFCEFLSMQKFITSKTCMQIAIKDISVDVNRLGCAFNCEDHMQVKGLIPKWPITVF